MVLTLVSGDSNTQNDDKKDYAGHNYYDAYTVFFATGARRQGYLLSGSFKVTLTAIH